MGQLVASGPTEYVARMGGVPNSTWTGLATVPTKHRPGRLRPNRVEYEAKAYETRKAGLSTKFSKGKSLTRFAKDVFKHLSDYGLDTISYAPNPEQRTVMSSVVEDHPKFTLDYIKSISSTQASRYDEYDQTNDAAAKDMLMASLDETLSDLVYNYVEIQSEPFIVVWMTFVDQLMEHSFDHFESLKESIKTTTFKQYPGENLASYCHAQREFCKELDCAGAYDFNLNRTLVANIAHAGGEGTNGANFRNFVSTLHRRVRQSLSTIRFKSKTAALTQLKADKADYESILTEIDREYRDQISQKTWDPAKNLPDSKAPPAQFGANLSATPTGTPTPDPMVFAQQCGTLSAMAMALMQQNMGPNTGADAPRKGDCRICGQAGHWARECPNKGSKPQSNSNSKSGSNRRSQQSSNRQSNGRKPRTDSKSNNTPWRTTFSGNSITRNGKTFNWCKKCGKSGRYTTTHTTETHTGGSSSAPSTPPAIEPSANNVYFEPAAWHFGFDSLWSSLWRLVMSGTNPFAPYLLVFLLGLAGPALLEYGSKLFTLLQPVVSVVWTDFQSFVLTSSVWTYFSANPLALPPLLLWLSLLLIPAHVQ